MKVASSNFLALSSLFIFLQSCSNSQASQKGQPGKDEVYQCIPCGYDCDRKTFTGPGECGECKMELVKSSTITFKTLEPSKVCEYIQSHPNTIVLDVRTVEEFEGKANPDFGTLKNAINLPIQVLESKLSTISSLKDKEILVYCSHSHRSPRASYILTQNGFTKVINLGGGMSVVKDSTCKK